MRENIIGLAEIPFRNALYVRLFVYSVILNWCITGCYFLVPNKKVTKEIGTGVIFYKAAPSYEPPLLNQKNDLFNTPGENVPIFAHLHSEHIFYAKERFLLLGSS